MKPSEIKEYLKTEKEVRINPQAMQKILQTQEARTKTLLESATIAAKQAKRKTIFPEDVGESKPETKADAKQASTS